MLSQWLRQLVSAWRMRSHGWPSSLCLFVADSEMCCILAFLRRGFTALFASSLAGNFPSQHSTQQAAFNERFQEHTPQSSFSKLA